MPTQSSPFLPEDHPHRKLTGKYPSTLQPLDLYIGQGDTGLEIAVLQAKGAPADGVVQQAYLTRKGNRAAPVLVVVLQEQKTYLCGPHGERPPVVPVPDQPSVRRLCEAALGEPDRHAATTFLNHALQSLVSELPGITNQGLLSTHTLTQRVPKYLVWKPAKPKAEGVIGKSGKELLSGLGFTMQPLDGDGVQLLLAGEKRRALAVLLNRGDTPETSTDRFNNVSPISYALTKADNENLPWVVVVQRDRLRLYNTKNIGVGRRGRTESYVECQISVLADEYLPLLWLLFSVEALEEGGTLEEILEQSQTFASDVADDLRERIYNEVVPRLADGVIEARNLTKPTEEEIALTYEMALTLLFRLLFIAYAEDRYLLPYKTNEIYKKRSLKGKALELAETFRQGKRDFKSHNHWNDIKQLFEAVSNGNAEWGVPAYNGAMFSTDPRVSLAGAEIAKLNLPNQHFSAALQQLLLAGSDDGLAPVDFQALSVREFGTIYEGLLESQLSLANQNLTQDNRGIYIPAKRGNDILVAKGQMYLHNRSGARKSFGSYYTKDFAVEHLLDGALEPALDEHLARLDTLDEAERTEQFFNFRVADIAMGSGHFLVAAIDRMERRFAVWLEQNPTPGIIRQLDDLRKAAAKELGEELAAQTVIDDGQILRRMIAKRCIYGVDLNELAVQLARLSIWIHTFVPGLPLSLLDHNLVCGNALVGVASLDEIQQALDKAKGSITLADPEKMLESAREPLEKLAKLSDASLQDIEEGRRLMQDAKEATYTTEVLCNLITASPVAEPGSHLAAFTHAFEQWDQSDTTHQDLALQEAYNILASFQALHFPIAFPEVFLGNSRGFDVILGNPPWKNIKLDERSFWVVRFPGIRGMSQNNQMKRLTELRTEHPNLVQQWQREDSEAKRLSKLLRTGNYDGLGTGDLDLYKAFCQRFLQTTSEHNGKIGVVLPRSALNAQGSAPFRKELFQTAQSIDTTILINTGKWAFDMEPRYTIALVCISKFSTLHDGLAVRGPFNSKIAYDTGVGEQPVRFPVREVLGWNDNASLPLLPSSESAEIFLQLRKAPRLDTSNENEWRAKPYTELHATAQKPLMKFAGECPDGFWPVYQGKSYNLWESDRGDYYAYADPKIILPWLKDKRLRAYKGGKGRKGAYANMSREHIEDIHTLEANYPRIAFRLITNHTNSRTMICALSPPRVFHSHSSQLIMVDHGDEQDEIYLLGILSSIPLDWYARCFVEINFTFHLLDPLPIPRPVRNNPLWQRVVSLAGRLACPDQRFADWAAAVGVECGPLDEYDKNDMIHELDAVVAHLYGLTEVQLTHIFATFHKGWSYTQRLEATLKHFRDWKRRVSDA